MCIALAVVRICHYYVMFASDMVSEAAEEELSVPSGEFEDDNFPFF